MGNRRVSPWRRPGAEQLFGLLGGDRASDGVLTRVVEQLDGETLPALAMLVDNAVKQARAEGYDLGWSEAGGGSL